MKTSSLSPVFTRVIDDKSYLGKDALDLEVKNRFQFFTAKRRAGDGTFYQVERLSGSKQPAYYDCMEDMATHDVYIAHPAESLPKYFVGAGVGAIPMTTLTVAWNVAMIIVTAVSSVFDVFQQIYPNRHDEAVTKGLLDRLKDKASDNYQEIKDRLTWIKSSLAFGVAIGAASLHALMNYDDAQTLFEMKVVVARIEFLWNRKQDFHKSALVQLNQFNIDLSQRLKKDPEANRVDVSIELFKNIHWSSIFSVAYIMQCFQSRGKRDDKVLVKETTQLKVEADALHPERSRVIEPTTHEVLKPVFEISPGSSKTNYKEFAEYKDKENPSWRREF